MNSKKYKIKKLIQEIKDRLSNLYFGSSEIVDIFLAGILSGSNILLWSSWGKGKSWLAEATAKLLGCSFSRIQGSAGLVESKFLARYNLPKLLQGEEIIHWHNFVEAKIKLFDEINRVPATVLNSLFSMLAEKMVIYGNERKSLNAFVFIATLNPADEGTIKSIPMPFLDRFDICLPMSTLNVIDKTKLLNIDKNCIYPVLKEDVIEDIWQETATIKITERIKFVTANMIRTLQICVQKNDKEFLLDFPAVCDTCRFKESICSKLLPNNPVSERAYLSTLKVAQGLVILQNQKEINLEHIFIVLPYVLIHRVKFLHEYEKQHIDKISAIRNLVDYLRKKEFERERAYKIIAEIKSANIQLLDLLHGWAQNDLVLLEHYNNLKKEFASKSQEENIQKFSLAQLEESLRKI
ncbi:MAG: MoxR family ATPase [Elusimicrobiota bacterium]